jgi:threonine/homoserine/homoserine lactone efflux protein
VAPTADPPRHAIVTRSVARQGIPFWSTLLTIALCRAEVRPTVTHRLRDGWAVSLAFLLTTLVVVATPGTGAVYSIAAGLSRGAKAGAVAAIGCTLGVVPHMVAAITGLAAVLNASAVAFQAIKWLGVAYLLYLAWQTVRDRGPLEADSDAGPVSSWRVIRTAVLINLLNPKLTIFFFAFLPQFVPAGSANGAWVMAWLSLVFMAVTLLVFALYGVFAATMRAQVISRPPVMAWLRRSFAATYVLLAGRLAFESR